MLSLSKLQAYSSSAMINHSFVNDSIDVEIPTEIITCKNETFQILLDPQYNYTWLPIFSDMCLNEQCSSVELTLTFDQTFVIIVSDGANCQDSFELNVIIDGESNNFINYDTICPGEQILFNGVFYSEAIFFCDTLTTDTICPQVQCLDLFVKRSDDITETKNICEGDQYEFLNQVLTESSFICIDTINSEGCDSTYCLDLIVNQNPQIELEGLESEILEGQQVVLSETNSFPEYQWSSNVELDCNDCETVSFIMDQETDLRLIVKDENNCKDTLETTIKFKEACRTDNLLIPNAITPNDNQRNERFRVVNFREEADEIEIKIFNRWGQLLFSDNSNQGWDGTYKNELVPEGVYLYTIEVICENGGNSLIKGDVTVLR